MNKVILIGRQTGEANTSYTPEGLAIARFNIAVDRRGKDKGADFPSVVAFGKTAEFIEKYGAKGKKWAVEGRIQTGSYEKDGRKVYTTDVIAENVEFVESKSAEKPANGSDFVDFSTMPVEVSDDEFMSIPDSISEEVPFV